MTRAGRSALAALTLVAVGVAGCGRQSEDGPSGIAAARAMVAGVPGLGALGGPKAPAAPARSPEAMAAEALRVNPGPLILAGIESQRMTQVLAMTGESATGRTYMTKAEQALILRGGMLTGTRGFGNDLASVDPGGAASLVRARQSGTGARVMRLWTGDGQETPLRLTCDVAPGAVVSASGVSGQQVAETCRAGAVTVQNNYLVTAGGAIPVSRQWAGPKLGYVTIQVVRP